MGAEVAFDLVADIVSLNVFAKVEELDVQGLHGVDGLDPGPLAQVLEAVGLVAFRVHRVIDVVVRVLHFLLKEGEDGPLHACGQDGDQVVFN